MTIREITEYLTAKSLNSNSPFGDIQSIRKKHLGIKPNPKKPFSNVSPKDDEGYAFHSGGRNEFQFNIGKDYLDGKEIFRYGLAFSLEPNINLTNPITTFSEARQRFNSYISDNKENFTNLNMWIWNGEEQIILKNVTSISDQYFQRSNFIFIGKYFEKGIDEVNESDIEQILIFFDSMMPFYKEVQFGSKIQNKKKWARITYNDLGWIRPSGRYGKSKTKDTHEETFGYGHEEWLLDDTKVIDGFRYGFLQPINNKEQSYRGKTFDISLFTIDGESKTRYIIGSINNLYALTFEEADKVKTKYMQLGWLDEMNKQILNVGADNSGYLTSPGINLFNVRYKLVDLESYDNWKGINDTHQINRLSRYNLVNLEESQIEDEGFKLDSSNINDGGDYKEGSILFERTPKLVESRNIHNQLSNALKSYLKIKYPNSLISREHKTGVGNTRIDLAVKINDDITFFEIKSYSNIKLSIREGVGQLLEYCYWPNQANATKLIILTQKLNGLETASKYMEHIRLKTRLNIYYQYFDLEANTFSKEY